MPLSKALNLGLHQETVPVIISMKLISISLALYVILLPVSRIARINTTDHIVIV